MFIAERDTEKINVRGGHWFNTMSFSSTLNTQV